MGLWAGVLRGSCLFTALPSHIKREQRAVFESKIPQTQLHGPGHVRLNARPGLCSRSACHWALAWGSRKPPGPAIETQVPVYGVTKPQQARTKGSFGVKIPQTQVPFALLRTPEHATWLCSRCACHWALVWTPRGPLGRDIERQVPVQGVTKPHQARTKGCF
jgi:hypothetical protein